MLDRVKVPDCEQTRLSEGWSVIFREFECPIVNRKDVRVFQGCQMAQAFNGKVA